MKIRFTLVLWIAIILMIGGLYLSFTQTDGVMGKKVFFIIAGILAWLIGNKLNELEDRLEELEKESKIKEPIKQTSAVVS